MAIPEHLELQRRTETSRGEVNYNVRHSSCYIDLYLTIG